jgi:hypothetical protein
MQELNYLNSNTVEGHKGDSFSDRIAFNVGISYVVSGLAGMLKGAYDGRPNDNLPKSLTFNRMLNNMSKNFFQYANAAGGAGITTNLPSLNFIYDFT